MSPIVDKVTKALEGVIAESGYELVDVEYEKKYEEMNLTIYVYAESGVSLDDCEKVHHIIDPILEELDPTNNKPFVLNVSSPGLDRPFKKQRDFERNYGKEVEIKLYAPLKGKKYFEGVLVEKKDNVTIVSVDGKEQQIEDSRIALVRPLVKFS